MVREKWRIAVEAMQKIFLICEILSVGQAMAGWIYERDHLYQGAVILAFEAAAQLSEHRPINT